ncbi:MAG TPA: hypothetical protein VNN25_16200 [Thermoanaerobaculia bacterium]|nr:hypothetical protein [Thermoanaerobaculia bacterium]
MTTKTAIVVMMVAVRFEGVVGRESGVSRALSASALRALAIVNAMTTK